MVNRKRFSLFLFISMLTLMLVACGGDKTSNGKSGDNSGDELSKVTFTYFNAAAPKKDVETKDTKIGAIFEEQTGVNFKMEHIVGDINTKIGVMTASGEYPDVLVPDIAIDKVLDAGAFIPLSELIEEHAPNIKKIYGPYLELMK